MRKLFPLLVLSLISSVAVAQSARKMVSPNEAGSPLSQNKPVFVNEPVSTGVPAPSVPVGTVLSDAVSSVKVGEATNGFTWLLPDNNKVSALPGTGTNGGTVAVIHRNYGANCGGGSGLLRYPISTDGGLTWNVGSGSNTPGNAPISGCYGLGPLNPVQTLPARYPNLALYQTPGTTGLSGVGMVYTGPVVAATWDGAVLGVATNVTSTPTVTQEIYPYASGTQYFSYSLVERVPGEFWSLGLGWNGADPVASYLNVNKGVLNPTTNQITWTTTVVNPPYDLSFDGTEWLATLAIAFSPDGQTGYISLIADLIGGSDSAYSVAFSETTDGGATWGAFEEVDLDKFPELSDLLTNTFIDIDTVTGDTVSFASGHATAAFDLDLVVDKNGNPHAIAVVCNNKIHNGDGTYSFPSPPYTVYGGLEKYVFDFTRDTFGDWNMILLDRQEFFRGTFGPTGQTVTFDPFVQASRSADGQVVILSWTDSDTTGGTASNIIPDLKAVALDVDSYMHTPVKNFTAGDANWAGKAIAPSTAPVSFYDGSCVYTLPTAIMDPENSDNANQFTSFWYYTDVTFDACTEFTEMADFFFNCAEAPFAFTPTATAPACGQSNGSIEIVVTGGEAPYTYLWDAAAGNATTDSVGGLGAGTYVVVATDAKGCSESFSITLNNADAPVLSISGQANVSCAGASNGTATANITGGLAPFSYLWSNGETTATATALPAGNSTCTVTDANGCISVITVTLTAPTAISLDATAVPVSCAGAADGTATADAVGGTGTITYLWSNGQTTATATGLSGGTYTVTVTDANGCTSNTTVTVAEPSGAVITFSTLGNGQPNPPYAGSTTANVTGGTEPYTYSWTDPLGNPIATTGPLLFGLCGGDYILTVTDANGCSVTDTSTVPAVGAGASCVRTAIDPLAIGIEKIGLYPNPVQSNLSVQLEMLYADDVVVSIYNLNGQVVASKSLAGAAIINTNFDLSQQAAGLYLVKVTTSRGTVGQMIQVQ
ncbi:MAG: T9SS type A sorting domain-containing protein [Bacteroidia bacterium]|nr:T9SS type A sorting domain-containing protein [Bacteroidia bacterium]